MGFAFLVTACLFVAPEAIAQTSGQPNHVDQVAQSGDATVVSLIKQDARYSIFARILEQSGLADSLAGRGPFTVFVPSDAAFAGWPQQALERLFEPQNRSKLAALVMAHVLPGRIPSTQWLENPRVGIALGGEVLTYAPGGTGRINQAPLEQMDIQASNGVIHVVGAPLTPTLLSAMVPAFGGIGGQK